MNYRIQLICLKLDGTTVVTNDNNNTPEAFKEDEIGKYKQRVLQKFYLANGANIATFAPLAFWTIREINSEPDIFIDTGEVYIK